MYKLLSILALILISCKEEKSFADGIVLTFPKDTKMKTQEFDSDSIDFGSNIIYKGFIKDSIQIKYYRDIDWIPAPPPPNSKLKKSNYVLKKSLLNYFHHKPFQGISSEKVLSTDNLDSTNIQIIVNVNDTIPLYKMRNIKIITFNSYPVFIKKH